MKTRVVVLTLLLASAVSTELAAQTKKKVPAGQTTTPVAAPKSEAAEQTRARRTGQTTPGEEVAPTESTTKRDGEPVTVAPETTKPVAKPAEKSTEDATPPDEFSALRDQIASAATGSERIQLELKLVDALVAANKHSDAVTELHAAADIDVFDPQGFYNVGNSFARLGETDGAVQAYRKAIEQRKGRYSRAYNNIGVVMLRVGRWDESYDALMSALKLENFRYPEASYNLGRLYAARGQNDLAAREWRRVLAQDPDHKAAAEALARVSPEGRVVVEAPRVAVSKPVEAPTRVETARVQSQPKPPVEQVSSTRTSISPASPGAMRGPRTLALDQEGFDLLQRARSATEKGNTLDAISNYQRLISRQGGYFPPANLEVSFALLTVKRYDEAVGNLQLVASRDGERYPITYFHLGRVYEMQGELKSAEEMFSKAAALFGSKNAQFLLDVSRVREKKGDFKGALDAMEQYLALIKQQGQEPTWSDERLAALRQKASAAPKE
ncbi:MAG TPA: tetratricopeptide repeat protein [Pyrinomonadaceae bacterium]